MMCDKFGQKGMKKPLLILLEYLKKMMDFDMVNPPTSRPGKTYNTKGKAVWRPITGIESRYGKSILINLTTHSYIRFIIEPPTLLQMWILIEISTKEYQSNQLLLRFRKALAMDMENSLQAKMFIQREVSNRTM